MNKLYKPFLGLSVIAAAFALSFGSPRENGLQINIDPSPHAHASEQLKPWDLTKLDVMNRVILAVNANYVEPNRMDYQRMILGSLNAVQQNVAPVLINYDKATDLMTVQVNSAKKQFHIADVDSPWKLAEKFREILGFLQTHLQSDPDLNLHDIEYAAVNGMLHTLDPHTTLLTPDIFKEMQTSTRGEFGGLGIAISLREGHLTIIRPMPETPAYSAGLKRRDRIVKINDESTLNMPLNEAVSRLRGKPGSTVRLFISTKDKKTNQWSSPREVELTRAVIHIDSIEHRMLADHIGYVKINNFQGNTYKDLRKALNELHQKEMKGLILDLRDNPGGLFDRAVRVTDTFLSSGPIVTTSSQDPNQREEKFARQNGTEPNYPMVVLINGASASASEIVAGALKNHDRALIIGENSFGKGSVQMLYNFQDGSALKLTVAQYLTPGDLSIQGVGIVPDISISPMTVDQEDMDLQVDTLFMRESELPSHLTNESANKTKKPAVVLGYYLNKDLRQRLREAEPNEEENKDENNFLIPFARNLLTHVKSSNRLEMLKAAAPIIKRTEKQELAKVTKDLNTLGVDWSAGKNEGVSPVKVVATTSAGANQAIAGEPLTLSISVTNEGEHPLYQLRAKTKSDNRLFDARELVFGKLAPGETRSWSTTLGLCMTEDENKNKRVCRIPRGALDRADGIRIKFEEANGNAPSPVEVRTSLRALPMPNFAYSVQVAGDVNSSGNGQVQPGQEGTVYFQIINLGPGKAYDVQANMRNLSGRGILLRDGRFQKKVLKPGESWSVPFTFKVLPDFEGDEAELEIGIIDADLRASISKNLEVPIERKSPLIKEHSKRIVQVPARTRIYALPETDAPVIAFNSKSARYKNPITLNGYDRIELQDGRPGWIRSSNASAVSMPATHNPKIRLVFNQSPPRIDIEIDETYVTREDKFQIRGKASDAEKVRDLYIFSGDRKVFYESNQGTKHRTNLPFDFKVPLHPGLNTILVVARDINDSVSRRAFMVRRDGLNGSLLQTPRFDDEFFGNTH